MHLPAPECQQVKTPLIATWQSAGSGPLLVEFDQGIYRDGEVTFEKDLSSSSSYIQMRNLGTLVTSVTVAINRFGLKK